MNILNNITIKERLSLLRVKIKQILYNVNSCWNYIKYHCGKYLLLMFPYVFIVLAFFVVVLYLYFKYKHKHWLIQPIHNK